MTTNINLRAWRDERREERQKTFLTTSVLMLILAGGAVFLTGMYIDSQTDNQTARNSYLQNEITALDAKIKEIAELKEKRQRLLERLDAIHELQGNRPVIVRVFDELVRVLPEDLYYTKLARTGDMLQVDGRSMSNKDVSSLMRSLDRSPWFTEPNLSNVGQGEQFKTFNMQVSLSKPKAEEGS